MWGKKPIISVPGDLTPDLSDRNDRMEPKIKTTKNPGPKLNSPKNAMLNFQDIKFPKALNDITVTNLQIVLNTQKNPYLNQAAQKITYHYQIFLPKKILRSSLSLEI